MLKRNIVLGSMIALISAGSVQASDWRLMAYNTTFIVALEREGLRADGSVRNGWIAYGIADLNSGIDYFVTRYEWDCSQGTSRELHTIAYLGGEAVQENGGTGLVEHVAPDTDESVVLGAVCDGVDPAPNHAGWGSVAEMLRSYRATLPPS